MGVVGIVIRCQCNKRVARFVIHWRGAHNMSVKTAAYGSWVSPITSKIVTESSVRLLEVRTDTKNPNDVYWTEMRYDEEGRYVICKQTVGQGCPVSLTPTEFSARTLVHEYGGGAFFVNDGKVYFSNFKDQRLYVQKSEVGAVPEAITPAECAWRYADGELNEKTGKIFCVREEHKKGAKEPVNTVISLDPSSQQQTVLVKGSDFYSHPRVSPDGKTLVWVQWDHPNMPWNNTELWIADLNEAGDGISDARQVVGGADSSVIEPGWTTDNELLYVSDKSEWWNLYKMTSEGEHINLLPQDKETGGPHWAFNCTTYSVNPSGNGQVAIKMGGDLGILDLKTKAYKVIDTGFTSYRFLHLTTSGDIFCYGGSPTRFPCIIHVLPSGKVNIIKESKVLPIDKGYYSVPEEITWPTSNGDRSYGYLYLPQNKDFVGTEGTLPPLLVKAHGGPTSQSDNSLTLTIQYFTSRGFAVLDVNYRGSTGYGRTYRLKLLKNWGIYDMDDCCHGAQFLADSKKVDQNKLCIDGGSAGGYTTLACLTFRDTFKAGASHYGICDLEALAHDTHKFESRYLDSLIAPYSGDGVKIYKDRSPINFVDQLKCAMAFFQGDEDKIVPPNQAQMMFDAVKAKGQPTMFVLFEGEQHGFRKAENLQTALDGELYFFSKVFGFEAADITCDKIIHNM
ncbi:uncharacterized protein LOC110456701 [Mizuhopecten yessoensis]|uniref:Dipeptidyl peptidase family member 6 n=1 Tax=Mizuhopecten yessoensis TaxID=6573 RepID=A0A210QAG3_MIZYE|nr:uncharacterized protein LOC110456701 [Mizuhopecten yessoensis]OWF45705.1 Dipeptidyl peptidase family member 6 [Mizuhopecten yessoensis]